MRKLITLSFMLLFSIFFTVLFAEELGDFYPGKITVCFSKELVGNTIGEFVITKDHGIIVTPFGWFNQLASEYEIVELQRKHWVKDQQWHDNGRYPMNIFALEVRDHSKTEQLLSKLQKQSDVLFAELLAVDKTCYTPNDTDINQQWALMKIQAFDAWDIETGSEDIIIGIVDSGIKWNHPDLQANMWINTAELPGITIDWETGTISGGDGIDHDGNGKIDDIMGWDFYSNTGGGESNNPFQSLVGWNHGTHVAGCAAAVGDNGIGVAGIAFSSKILATKHSPYNTSSTDIINGYDGIYYMADTGAHIINCSWGGAGNAGDANTAVNYAVEHGSLVVVAAGNLGNDLAVIPFYPACATNAFTVANTDENDQKATSSNYGIVVDISAPGTDIRSTTFTGGGVNVYGPMSGTSQAAAIVSGVAALLKSQDLSLTVAELKDILRSTADEIDDLNPNFIGKLGTGRVNAFTAVIASIPSLTVSPSEYDFGIIDVATISPEVTFTMTNYSSANVVINQITLVSSHPENFILMTPSLPVSLIPGDYDAFYVNFSPVNFGEKEAIVRIFHSNSPTPNIVTLSGTGAGNYHTPYYQNFDSGTSLTQINWTGTLNNTSGIFTQAGVQGSNALALNVSGSSATQNVITPPLDNITSQSHVSFAYRIVDYTSDWSGELTATTLALTDLIHVEVATSSNPGVFTTIYTIDNSNQIVSTDFSSIFQSLSAFEGTDINIRFRAVRGNGDWYFVLDDVFVSNTLNIPFPPSNPSPSNGASNLLFSPTLSWYVSPLGGSPAGQYLYLDTVNPPVQMFTIGDSPTWTPATPLQYNTTYYWCVVPYNATGSASGCPVWSFTTRNIVGAPLLESPSDGGVDVTINTSLSWSAGLGEAPTSYTVQIDTVNPPLATYEDILTTSFSPDLDYETTYYWRVRAFCDENVSVYSSVWTFTTAMAAPNPVTLIAPVNAATGVSVTPTFEWEADLGNVMPTNITYHTGEKSALTRGKNQNESNEERSRIIPDSYRLQVSRSAIFNPRDLDVELAYPTNTYTVPENNALLYNTPFYWRVIPINASGFPTNNQIFTFNTAPAPPVIAINPSSYDFGELEFGLTSQNVHFTITNTAGGPLIISNIAIEGPNANE
ncbi:MAG: S8 family serine peptidase, partial [Candidatus Cloacimonetes bacterium]|nr:S8 family serine peptidase [Candidatus Cloacimonadota bacterium]